MSKELELEGYAVDSVTGFLEKKEKNSFCPREKTAFLKAFKSHGDQSKAAHALGYPFEVVELHLRIDPVFKRAFASTLLEMRHELEGKLYRAAMQGETKELKMWLEVHFPETYKPSASRSAKADKDTSVIDDLYKKSL